MTAAAGAEEGPSGAGEEEAALWRRAYEAEQERRERLQASDLEAATAAAAPPPDSAADARAWREAYEALRDTNRALEETLRARSAAEEAARKPEEREEAKEEARPPPPPRISESSAPTDAAGEGKKEGKALRPKVLSVLDLPFLDAEEEILADVGRFRDVLGPGVLPLLSALFGQAASEDRMPPLGDVREALALPGTRFRQESSLDLGRRCCIIRGTLDRGAVGGEEEDGDSWSAQTFLQTLQQRLDTVFGAGRLTAFLQRERYPPTPGLDLVRSVGKFDTDGAGADGAEGCKAVLMIFLTSDLPVPEPADSWRRLAIGSSGIVTLVFSNTVALAVSFLQEAGGEALVGSSVEQASYSPALGVAVSRLDPLGVLPIGLGILAVLAAQDAARSAVAEARGAKVRSGFYLPSPSLGSLGRTWSFEGLAPSRRAQLEVCLAGTSAGFGTALLLCLLGVLQGNAADGLLCVEVTRLPLLLAQSLGDSFPADSNLQVLGLKSGEPASSLVSSNLVPLDPLIFSGSLGLTMQAIQLLPLKGLDGHILARSVLGGRLTQLLELSTGILLLVGVANRLGPNANPATCASALFAWALCFLAAQESPMPPLEDLDDESSDPDNLPLALGSAALLAAGAAVLLPGKLVPYGLLQANVL